MNFAWKCVLVFYEIIQNQVSANIHQKSNLCQGLGKILHGILIARKEKT